MPQIPIHLHLLRSLKGAPLSVLVALALSGQPQNARWLQRHTGYGDEAVYEALTLLQEYALVMRGSRYSWQICANVYQLPLSALTEGDSVARGTLSIASTGNESVAGTMPTALTDSSAADRAESDSGKNGVPKIQGELFAGTPENPGSDSGKSGIPHSSSSRFLNLDTEENPLLPDSRADSGKSGVLNALDAAGIREPARTHLARLAHVTVELVQYHLATSGSIGQAIYRIEHNWRIDARWQPPGSIETPWEETSEAEIEVPDRCVRAFSAALEAVREKIPAVEFETWCKNLQLVAVNLDDYTVAVANSYVIERLSANNIQALLEEMLSGLSGEPTTVKFKVF